MNHFKEISLSKPEKVEFEGTKYGGKLWRYWMTQEENSNFKHDITNREGEVELRQRYFCLCNFLHFSGQHPHGNFEIHRKKERVQPFYNLRANRPVVAEGQ